MRTLPSADINKRLGLKVYLLTMMTNIPPTIKRKGLINNSQTTYKLSGPHLPGIEILFLFRG